MKKLGVFVLLSLFLLSGFASAQNAVVDGVESFLGDVTSAIYPVAKYILGSTADAGASADEILVKILVFLIVVIFTAAAVKRIPLLQDKPGSSFAVSIVVAIIGVRFITTDELINLIWLPTSTLTVAITSIIPFVIFFFLIEGFESRVLRKFGWTTYLVIFLYFAISRWTDPTLRIGGASSSATGAWIYLIIAFVSSILIFFDRDIHAMFRRQALNNITDRTKRIQAVQVAADIDDLYLKLSKARDAGDRSAIEQEIATKEANLKRLYS